MGRSQVAARLAVALGWIGGAYGMLTALYAAPHMATPREQELLLWYYIPQYAIAFLLVTARRRGWLLCMLLAIMMPMHMVTFTSTAFFPGLVLVTLSTSLFYLAAGQLLAAAAIAMSPVIIVVAFGLFLSLLSALRH